LEVTFNTQAEVLEEAIDLPGTEEKLQGVHNFHSW
jgi:hypothetical protein